MEFKRNAAGPLDADLVVDDAPFLFLTAFRRSTGQGLFQSGDMLRHGLRRGGFDRLFTLEGLMTSRSGGCIHLGLAQDLIDSSGLADRCRRGPGAIAPSRGAVRGGALDLLGGVGLQRLDDGAAVASVIAAGAGTSV